MYVVASVFITNTLIILFSILYSVSDYQKEEIIKKDFKKWAKLNFWNLIKTLIGLISALGIWGGVFFISFGFSAVYSKWAYLLWIIWAFTLLADFVMMEIGFELLILLFYICRGEKLFEILMKFFLTLKNLRNNH